MLFSLMSTLGRSAAPVQQTRRGDLHRIQGPRSSQQWAVIVQLDHAQGSSLISDCVICSAACQGNRDCSAQGKGWLCRGAFAAASMTPPSITEQAGSAGRAAQLHVSPTCTFSMLSKMSMPSITWAKIVYLPAVQVSVSSESVRARPSAKHQHSHGGLCCVAHR